jgi:hypothetical protein
MYVWCVFTLFFETVFTLLQSNEHTSWQGSWPWILNEYELLLQHQQVTHRKLLLHVKLQDS